MKLPQVYIPATDELEDVTQKWCDSAQHSLGKLALQRAIVKAVLNLNVTRDSDTLDEINKLLNNIGLKTI